MAAAPVPSKSPAPSETTSEKLKQTPASPSSAAANLDNLDFPHFKDLQRSLRNAAKKLNATAKLDGILAENPKKSLDELVAEKKINTDQKAQVLKKPALQASVVQYEEQIARYKEFAVHYEERLTTQKTKTEKAHKAELDAARAAANAEARETREKEYRSRLLSLSKFLCSAAAMRRSGDETSSESRAFEGVLYQVYGGSNEAVESMVKLIGGVDEKIVSVEGEQLDVTYGKVKQISEGYAPAEATTGAPASDPTVANAASTELQDASYGTEATPASEATGDASQTNPPPQTLVSDAANQVAEKNWDANAPGSLASSANTDSWVEVQRDPAETENGLKATPAAAAAGLSNITTAPDAANQSAEAATAPNPPSGEPAGAASHQRQPSFRGRGRGRGRGDGFRGRGRGEFRGRGRGGRGGRGRGGANSPGAAPTAPQ
ncbi:hypothetical protein P168DRAFT_239204 [Aspergillus campestris IBT 28561]|uniref:YAG7-like dimerisation domain-containing protein n=1 Tax=Aspergillus campestris (strain IBT 28561) TaxID=1392248 RepID=A0A2I1CXS8_ASPC2|nr:uncharacterized protein P168DRAFT_239204 [Aspergillus campestris IBT 28561]PKY02439.1 hypothetical protein P168DRAFT_239204 [Aspergillus campestris IBT 28561]